MWIQRILEEIAMQDPTNDPHLLPMNPMHEEVVDSLPIELRKFSVYLTALKKEINDTKQISEGLDSRKAARELDHKIEKLHATYEVIRSILWISVRDYVEVAGAAKHNDDLGIRNGWIIVRGKQGTIPEAQRQG
jgi:hypothetical protein